MDDNGWIAKEYEVYYKNLKDYVVENSTVAKGLRYFTPHDSSHCYSVEKIVKGLVDKSKVDLNDLEKFILLSAVWTHDLGMVDGIAKEHLPSACIDEKRERHDEVSAWHLKKHFKEIFGLNEAETPEDKDKQSSVQRYVHTVNTISKYHRRKEDVNKCHKELFVENEEIRTRLLACFLRLGDTLHVDFSRFDKEFYDILQIGNFDRVARLHWLKSYVVSNVHIDDKKETIVINIDLPEFKPEDNVKYKEMYNLDKNELEEGYNKLSSILKEDIYEDVFDVNETFREYDLTCYTAVKPIINLISGYDENDVKEIFGIINDIEIILSPNDSKVNKKAISSIRSLCKADFSEYEVFYNHTKQLIEHLEAISNKRPCHVGLKNIVHIMNEIFEKKFTMGVKNGNISEIKRLQRIINKEIDEISDQRRELEGEVYNRCEEFLEGRKHIFVCGFSEMVSNFLNEYSKRDKGKTFKDIANIYVLEFGGKRRFLRNNVDEYNDGIYYSIHLKKMGFKNINLMPDTSLASCINHLKEEKVVNSKNSVVLFGANGIDENGNCGHSSGHLTVAIVAKHFRIPVKVISNKFKEGEIQWKLSELRRGNWLTGQKNRLKELDDHNIKLVNYLEDKVPKKLFGLITNQHGAGAKSTHSDRV